MKRLILVVLGLCMVFSFSWTLNADEGKVFLDLKPAKEKLTRSKQVDRGMERQRRERHSEARQAKDASRARASLFGTEQRISTPNAVDIEMVSGTTAWQEDSVGDVVWTGVCANAGTSAGVFVRVDVDIYDAGDNYLGSDYTYVWGGSNCKLNSSGLYTNSLGAGDYGFFKIWTTNISYAQASYLHYAFSYETYAHTTAMAHVGFDGSVYYTDYLGSLDFYGNVKNSSSSYISYFTKVAFAVFDTSDTYVLDVDYTYVDGSTYGASTSALYPGESGPFDVWFLFADYSSSSGSYLSSFEWDETTAGSLTEKDPPFGTFDTPLEGATVASSVAVTGWVLDDSGVENVKVYRKEGGSLVYLGDAAFVEGARPDVAAAYPQYPNNTKAGWGYMMLTNFLPGGGNGTFEIHAIATDAVGKTTTLGTRTINVDNANAVKPFGAIDTPTQGGASSGSSFVNWGWVLTPQPNSIPTDGSTINVWVDGVSIGHPNYNVYRSDIATFFPGYANSNGAVGYFMLDTTGYTNGVHTIQWTAKDTGNNADGIGSRFFSISNSSRSKARAVKSDRKAGTQSVRLSTVSDLNRIPDNFSVPIRIKKGYKDSEPHEPFVAGAEKNHIVIKQQERIVLNLTDNAAGHRGTFKGYHVINGRLMSLPIGSTLDKESGAFYWIPPQGFLGRHQLVFVETAADGTATKRNIFVDIVPETK